MFNPDAVITESPYLPARSAVAEPGAEKLARFVAETEQKAKEHVTRAFVADLPGLAGRFVLYSEELPRDTGLVDHRVAFSVNEKPFDVILETNSRLDWITTGEAFQAAAKAIVERVTGAVWDQIIGTGALR